MKKPRPFPIWTKQVTFQPDPSEGIEFLIEDLLPVGYLALLASTPKTGKTCLATAMALAVASGTEFAGLKTNRTSVLWLSLEESKAERNLILNQAPEHIKKILKTRKPIPIDNSKSFTPKTSAEPAFYQSFTSTPIDTPEGIAEITAAAAELEAKLIVIDPLHAATSGRLLYDGSVARQTLQELKLQAGREGFTVLVLHHVRERGPEIRPAESQQLSATSSMYMVLDRLKMTTGESWEDDLPNGIHFRLITRGRGDFANRIWHFHSESPLHYEPCHPPEEKPEPKTGPNPIDQMVKNLLLTKSMTAQDIVECSGMVPGTVLNAVTRLYRRGEIDVCMIVSGKRKYKLSRNRNESDESNESNENSQAA